MNYFKMSIPTDVLIAVLLALFFRTGGAEAASAPNCGGWSVVSSPSRGAKANFLSSVAAISANDIWTVGSSGGKTLTEHWNGTQWSTVSSPNPGVSNQLDAVTQIPSTTQLWAVGYYRIQNSANYNTLTESYC